MRALGITQGFSGFRGGRLDPGTLKSSLFWTIGEEEAKRERYYLIATFWMKLSMEEKYYQSGDRECPGVSSSSMLKIMKEDARQRDPISLHWVPQTRWLKQWKFIFPQWRLEVQDQVVCRTLGEGPVPGVFPCLVHGCLPVSSSSAFIFSPLCMCLCLYFFLQGLSNQVRVHLMNSLISSVKTLLPNTVTF